MDNEKVRKILGEDLMLLFIRIGVVSLLVVLCAQVFAPFLAIMLWALILAVTLYPMNKKLAKAFSGKQGRAATFIVVIGIILIGVPTTMLAGSFAEQMQGLYASLQNDEFTISPPNDSVADWPLVGQKVHQAWSAAASDLPGYIKEIRPQLENVSKQLLSMVASTAGSIGLFIGALVIAGIMMAYGESGSAAMKRISCRIAGNKVGEGIHGLSTATIRSVAMGVIGVAFIQALLLGIGFIIAGVPAAGVLALISILIGILQLPALIISLPVIAYIWWAGDSSTAAMAFYTAYLIIAGFSDQVLKPLLLGRGVDAPMPVILIGALGGMVSSGFIGLFFGAVVLAVGYQIFMGWVDNAFSEDQHSEHQAAVASDD
jgi:predicted PurR-regulated permease PerM